MLFLFLIFFRADKFFFFCMIYDVASKIRLSLCFVVVDVVIVVKNQSSHANTLKFIFFY